ncbi:cytochrome c oxidase subunit II [Glacieibacterium frigidum]|nr:cytochrome c oxidase subunit II [Glacieibacterium frigidum]
MKFLVAALLALAPVTVAAQVAAAPVTPVETVAVPAGAAAPVRVAPDSGFGQPNGSWQLQQPVTKIARDGYGMVNGILNPLMIGISIFVLALLGWVIFRYRAARNPTASRTSHNTLVEVIWTVVPVLLLVWIAVPSFRLLANQYAPQKADLTIKATGHQWYWEYEYPDQGGFSFDSIMLTKAEAAKAGSPYMLDVDNRIVVPVGKTVKVLTTSADVIHAWMVPAFWVQMDAVPGRINETWFKADKPGVYFGQCYQLCGTRHAFMPIAVEVVSQAQFDAWVAAKKRENGITDAPAAAAPAAAGGSAAAEAATTPTPAEPVAPAPAPAAAAPTA